MERLKFCCFHFLALLFFIRFASLPRLLRFGDAAAAPITVDVGVLLDLRSIGNKRSITSIAMAIDDFYAINSNYTTRIVLHTTDSEGDVVGAASAEEKLESNLSRLAVIIWVFVVLILTSSYKASLTSLLTVQHLQPTVTDIGELLINAENVGYQDGSFVVDMLKQMKFDATKLHNLSTVQQYADALSKGSRNGGVAAIFDEIPYLKLFLSQHCPDYAMVGRSYKTGGFGFVFPRGSPIVPDVSTAILNVKEGDTIMSRIETKWFGGDPSTCTVQSDNVASTRLGFQSFQGLFLVTGAVSLFALTIFFLRFLYAQREEMESAVTESSPWKTLVAWARHYDRKDENSYTFRRERPANLELSLSQHGDGLATPNVDGSQSPVSMSNFSDANFGPAEEGTESPLADTSLEMKEIREN